MYLHISYFLGDMRILFLHFSLGRRVVSTVPIISVIVSALLMKECILSDVGNKFGMGGIFSDLEYYQHSSLNFENESQNAFAQIC